MEQVINTPDTQILECQTCLTANLTSVTQTIFGGFGAYIIEFPVTGETNGATILKLFS